MIETGDIVTLEVIVSGNTLADNIQVLNVTVQRELIEFPMQKS